MREKVLNGIFNCSMQYKEQGEDMQTEENIFSHICVPLIKKDQKWKQIDDDLLIEVGNEEVEPALFGRRGSGLPVWHY